MIVKLKIIKKVNVFKEANISYATYSRVINGQSDCGDTIAFKLLKKFGYKKISDGALITIAEKINKIYHKIYFKFVGNYEDEIEWLNRLINRKNTLEPILKLFKLLIYATITMPKNLKKEYSNLFLEIKPYENLFINDFKDLFHLVKIIFTNEINFDDLKSDYENEDHDHNHDHDHDHDEEYNPHVWLSVKNAIKQVENIESKLIEYNPENKDVYSNNTKEYVSNLNELDTKIHNELDKIQNKNIVTFHEAFPYFAKEYNLNIVAVVEREPGSEPSAKELQETIEKIKKLDVKAICVEPQYSTKSAQTISKETNVGICTLDPIVTEESKNSSYIEIMNKNLETLKEALQ